MESLYEPELIKKAGEILLKIVGERNYIFDDCIKAACQLNNFGPAIKVIEVNDGGYTGYKSIIIKNRNFGQAKYAFLTFDLRSDSGRDALSATNHKLSNVAELALDMMSSIQIMSKSDLLGYLNHRILHRRSNDSVKTMARVLEALQHGEINLDDIEGLIVRG